MNAPLEIKLEGRRVTAGAFRKAVGAFLDLVEGVSGNLENEGGEITWVIEVEKGSAILRATPTSRQFPNKLCERVSHVISSGIKELRNHSGIMPEGFSEDTLMYLRTLADLADPEGDDIQKIAIRNGGEPLLIDRHIATSADDLLGEGYEACGSVEGFLKLLGDTKTGLKCTISDPFTNRNVRCKFSSTELEDKAIRAFRKRVAAYGVVKYGRDGNASSVTVEDIDEFQPDSDLPSYRDVEEIWSQKA